MLLVLITLALIFNFLNGFHDSSNIVATVISSNALRPRPALLLAASAEFAAPFLFGIAVANTIGKGFIDPAAVNPITVIAGLLAAITWNLLTWFLGLPSSSSHALIGGLLGSAILARGLGVVNLDGLLKILISLFLSPILGLVVGFILMNLLINLFQSASPRINIALKRMQIATSISLAFSHGSNDAQKTMGVIAMGLVTAGFQETFSIPLWVIAASAASLALGTALGGWRLIHSLGGRIIKIRPIHAFTSQAASALIILGAAILGGPVSTTQVVGSSIIGVGAAERMSKVRWGFARSMLTAWFVTIPVTALVAAILYLAYNQFT